MPSVAPTHGRLAGLTVSKDRYASHIDNRFLARLPETVQHQLQPHLKPVKLAFRAVLYEFRGQIEDVFFPTGGVTSSLMVMRNGDAIEVATVGNEGIVGHTVILGGVTSPNKVIVQIGGDGLRIEGRLLKGLAVAGGPLRALIEAYDNAFRVQVSQSVACNGLHRLEQRCCRWLLMTRDRVASDDLKLSHEYLAIMLGARRASVTSAIRPLQDAGLIRSQHGRIIVLDRAGLEERVCECYWVVKEEYDRFYG